jgi:hypothetical protein
MIELYTGVPLLQAALGVLIATVMIQRWVELPPAEGP